MHKIAISLIAMAAATISLVPQANAEQLIESYGAYIGEDDLYNSGGARLTKAWQIIRQDRANYHRFGRVQNGDEGDNYFDNIDNRALLETMVRRGSLSWETEQAIKNGQVRVFIDIYGEGRILKYVNVSVSQ